MLWRASFLSALIIQTLNNKQAQDDTGSRFELQVSLFGHVDKKYDIIYADPPWNIRWQGSKSIGTKPLQYLRY